MKQIHVRILLIMIIYAYGVHAEYITNPYQVDGFGSQFQNIIAAALYAELTGKPFVYSPFQAMEHNYDNDPDFLAKKEDFINFIGNFELNDGSYGANNAISYKPIIDTYPELCAQSATLAKVKRLFRANKNADYFKNERFNIAIHLRRPNQQDNRIEGTNTPDQLFLDTINALRTCYRDKKPFFHIYSQGNTAQFQAFAADDIVLHLNESVEDTFQAFVFADVLVTSASSLSYTAALLSESPVYYIPFWHSPLPRWISIHELIAAY